MLEPIFTPAPQGDVDDLIFADCDWRQRALSDESRERSAINAPFPLYCSMISVIMFKVVTKFENAGIDRV